MPIVDVGDQEIEFPDDMSDAEITAALNRLFPIPAANKNKTQTKPTGVNIQGKDVARGVGLTANAIGRGVMTIPNLVSDVVSYPIRKGIDAIAGTSTPSASEVTDSLAKRAFPQPHTSGEKLLSSTVQGAAALPLSPLMAVQGALAGGATEMAAQNDLPVPLQIGAGIAAAGAPGALKWGAAKVASIVSRSSKSAGALSVMSPDKTVAQAVQPAIDKYKKVEQIERQAWGKADKLIIGKKVNGDYAKAMVNAVDDAMYANNGMRMNHKILRPIKDALSEVGKMGAKKTTSKILGANDAELTQIFQARRALSTLAGTSSDPVVRRMAAIAYKEVDKQIENMASAGIINKEAADATLRAIRITRAKYAHFGTGDEQSSAFSKLVTKESPTAADISSVTGSTLKMTPAEEQTIIRSIKEATTKAPESRAKFAQYFLEQATDKSRMIANGEEIINPDSLRKQLDLILRAETGVGGISAGVRDAVFTADDLAAIQKIRDNIPKRGLTAKALSQIWAHLPFTNKLRALETAPNVTLGIKTRKMMEPVIEKGAKEGAKTIKKSSSTPTSPLIGGAASGNIMQNNKGTRK